MKEIWNFLKKRFKDNDSVFWMYFFVIVCGVGAAGIWANIFPAIVAWDWGRLKIESLAGALYTFFPPVLVGACADILLPDTNTKTIRMFAIVLLILTFSWLMLCANSAHPCTKNRPKTKLIFPLRATVSASVFQFHRASFFLSYGGTAQESHPP